MPTTVVPIVTTLVAMSAISIAMMVTVVVDPVSIRRDHDDAGRTPVLAAGCGHAGENHHRGTSNCEQQSAVSSESGLHGNLLLWVTSTLYDRRTERPLNWPH